LQRAVLAMGHLTDEAEANVIPLLTGSAAEFYIEPMLPLVGDIDVMAHHSNELAIPRGHPTPTQLPDEFSNYVKVFEIVDSHLPGYVYLQLRYLLSECTENGKFSNFEYYHRPCLTNIHYHTGDGSTERNIHGPALLRDYSNSRPTLLSIDVVPCIRCLSWPPQAADWPTRHRNYDWPDSATVERVVSDGCDMVSKAHLQCRQHEWMSKHQWRLSFSRAEIILLNSWMPVQQIVYHMLRVFVKTEQLTDSGNNSEPCALSNYHIKQLMLWACELKSSSFWIIDLNLIRICVKLLHTLSVWLKDGRCPNYFINNCNLIDNSFDVEMVSSQLISIDQAWLSTWFLNNYMQTCFLLCPDNFSTLFSNVSMLTILQSAVSAVVDWRLNTALKDTWLELNAAELIIAVLVSYDSLTVQSCNYLMTELPKMYPLLTVYFTAAVFLHIAYKIPRITFTDQLMDVLATVAGHSISTRRHPSQCSSELSLSRATKLMKVVANSSHSTMQQIEIELSKAYLHRALRCKDSDSDSIYCLANVYLAVLYYTTRQFRMAIDHCTLVMRSQDHSQCSSHVVEGELLSKIDDDIDNVLGLAVFYQYVLTAALNQRQTQHVSIFTTELFAHYLNTRCLSAHLCDEYRQLTNYFCSTQVFIADVLAVKSDIHNFHCQSIALQSSQQPTPSTTDLNTSELVELLQKSAVEHLTTYRQLLARDFGSVATFVTTDFEALYAYKHGDYQRCLQLSTQNVHTLLEPVCTPNVLTLPEFIQLLDDDIVSLTALILIVNPECRDFPDNIYITQLTLSLYLMTQCQLKLRHSVTSLVQTLDYIEFAQSIQPAEQTLNHLTLKLTKRKVLISYILN